MLFRSQGLFGIDIADDDQNGIIGCVELFVPSAQIVGAQGVQVFHIADNGGFHGGQGKAVQIDLFPHFPASIVFRALAAFFSDNVHFGSELFIAEIEVVHPVGFKFENFGQVGRGDIGVI